MTGCIESGGRIMRFQTLRVFLGGIKRHLGHLFGITRYIETTHIRLIDKYTFISYYNILVYLVPLIGLTLKKYKSVVRYCSNTPLFLSSLLRKTKLCVCVYMLVYTADYILYRYIYLYLFIYNIKWVVKMKETKVGAILS